MMNKYCEINGKIIYATEDEGIVVQPQGKYILLLYYWLHIALPYLCSSIIPVVTNEASALTKASPATLVTKKKEEKLVQVMSVCHELIGQK